jgi:predicted kinase
MAWEFLWRLGLPQPRGKQVFHLVRWHQRPFHLTFAPALERDVITQAGNWRELLALARADNLGRIAPNTAETAASLDLLEGEIVKRACMDGPWRFPSDGARLWFGRAAGRSPWFEPPAPTGSHVVVLCGLPGAGMDTHCRKAFPDWPQVSLDQLRQALEVLPNDNQGQVIQAAMEEARAHLRAKRRFVWNATNVSRLNRDKAVGLCLGYDAFIEIHAFDPPPDRLLIQNQGRDAKVPQTVFERLIRKWEPPSILEAHRVIWIVSSWARLPTCAGTAAI